MISGRQPSDYTRNIVSSSPADAVFISTQAPSHQASLSHTVLQSNPICAIRCVHQIVMLSSVPGYALLSHITWITSKINIAFRCECEIVKTGSLIIIYLFICLLPYNSNSSHSAAARVRGLEMFDYHVIFYFVSHPHQLWGSPFLLPLNNGEHSDPDLNSRSLKHTECGRCSCIWTIS